MANFTDSEVTTIQNALVATRQALEADKSTSPQVQEIIKMIIESERILSGKGSSSTSQTVGTSTSVPPSSAAMNRYFNTKHKPERFLPLPMGAAANATVIQKTKALFSMFHPNEYCYEPEPIGGSIASKIVAGHKVQKTKALFEMFNLT